MSAETVSLLYSGGKGYHQPPHTDDECWPSYSLGVTGAKNWTFHWDHRGQPPRYDAAGRKATSMIPEPIEIGERFDTPHSTLRFTHTMQPGDLLLYAVWITHQVDVLQDGTRSAHGSWKYGDLSGRAGRVAPVLPDTHGFSVAQRCKIETEGLYMGHGDPNAKAEL